MAFAVVLDACVLYPAPLRDLLLRLAVAKLYRARWSNQILDECFRSIVKMKPELSPERLEITRQRMNAAVPDVLVSGYEDLVEGLKLPDPNDRHVLAAAIRAGAQVIVTANLSDFPASALEKYDVEAQHPDEFVLSLLELYPEAVLQVVSEQAAVLKNPPQTVPQLLETLHNNGLKRTVTRLRQLLGG